MLEETLFAAALEKRPGADRQAFLVEACGDDASLRRRVERLLAVDARTDDFLDCGQDVLAAQAAAVAWPPARDGLFAGRFRLCNKLGEGGMGEVWAVDQLEPVQRRVALKVINQAG